MKQKSRFGLVVAARIHCSVHGAEQGIRLGKGRERERCTHPEVERI